MMIGKTDFDFLPADQAQKAFDDDNQILQTGKAIINYLEKITASDGSEQWFSVTKVPRYDGDGKVIGTLGISRNVTEWKKLQEIQR
jgi:PAS domain S-box-containing protein